MKFRFVLLLALVFGPASARHPSTSSYRCSDDSLQAKIPTSASEWSVPVLQNPRLNQLYISGYNMLYVIDCSTDAVVDSVRCDLGAGVPALDSTDNKLYCPTGQSVVVYDCIAKAVVATIPLPYYLSGHVVWSPTCNKVYMSFDLYRSCVMVIDCWADTVLKYIPIVGGASVV